MLPRFGRDGLRVFLSLDNEYANNVREKGGSGAGNAPIQKMYLRDKSYLDLLRRDGLPNRQLSGVPDRELLNALRRKAGISDEGPSLAKFCPRRPGRSPDRSSRSG